MAHDLRFIMLNRSEQLALELRAVLLKFNGVRIVAEVEEPAMLNQAVTQFGADVVMVDLDPAPEAILPIVGEVTANHRDVAVFATSDSTEGSLILKAMRLGIREFFPRPIDAKTLGEAIERVASTRVAKVNQGTLITVTGASGGVGATMVATNLAVELGEIASHGVTAVDLDLRFGQVATFLDVDPTYTLADLCQSGEQLEPSVVTRAMIRHDSGINVLSRPLHLAESDAITAGACVGVLSTLVQMNEYVVTDGPTRFDHSAHSIFALSDVNLLVVQLVVPSVRNALRILEGMRQAGCNTDRTRLICNRTGRDSGHLSLENISETLGLEIFATIPDDWTTVSGAINLGEPLRSHGPKSKARAAIQEIAVRLHSPRSDADDCKDERKKSLIGRIFAAS